MSRCRYVRLLSRLRAYAEIGVFNSSSERRHRSDPGRLHPWTFTWRPCFPGRRSRHDGEHTVDTHIPATCTGNIFEVAYTRRNNTSVGCALPWHRGQGIPYPWLGADVIRRHRVQRVLSRWRSRAMFGTLHHGTHPYLPSTWVYREALWEQGSGFIAYGTIMAIMLLVGEAWIRRSQKSPEWWDSWVIMLWVRDICHVL